MEIEPSYYTQYNLINIVLEWVKIRDGVSSIEAFHDHNVDMVGYVIVDSINPSKFTRIRKSQALKIAEKLNLTFVEAYSINGDGNYLGIYWLLGEEEIAKI